MGNERTVCKRDLGSESNHASWIPRLNCIYPPSQPQSIGRVETWVQLTGRDVSERAFCYLYFSLRTVGLRVSRWQWLKLLRLLFSRKEGHYFDLGPSTGLSKPRTAIC